jgi:hypothetical protein
MSVYVDQAENPYGRMLMCHMIADSTDELVAMAKTVGVHPRWIQKKGTAQEHFDICKSKRALALKAGAIDIDRTRFVEIIRAKREVLDAART